MGKDENKIINDILNYLKFYKENSNYAIYDSEIKVSEHPLIFNLTEIEVPAKANVHKAESSATKGDSISAVPDNKLITEKVKEDINTVTKILTDPVKEKKIPLIKESWMECDTLEAFEESIKDCPKCIQLAKTRKQIVFGTGNPNADVVVVGEAPGADENEQGKPFVGRAGKLLTDILKAIQFTREEVFILNILKCRPPENRNPLPDEIANCEPYLFKQLDMIKPKLILALGTFASQTLLRSKEPLGKLRGKFHTYNGIKMMVTYHPAALLRNPNWKKPTWEDVQLFRKEYDSLINN